MASDSVWISMVHYDIDIVQTHLDFDPDQPARAALKAGRDPTDAELPAVIYGRYKDRDVKDLPPLFDGGGAITISAALAGPLLKLELGSAAILPLRILKADKKTEVLADRGYYQILRYDALNALAPEASRNLDQSRYDASQYGISIINPIEDGDIAVHASAITQGTPIIWNDPQLVNSWFFSGKAVDALKANGVAKFFQFKKCRIID